MIRRVGICRALHAYDYLCLWQTFFERLGFDVLLSGASDRSMVEAGVRIAPAELCLPVKTFLGHVLSLIPKVDVLFIPRLVCRRLGPERYFGCPKALALPDMTRALIANLPPVAELVIDERISSEVRSFQRLGRELGVGPRACARARRDARVAHLGLLSPEPAPPGAAQKDQRARVGIVGHSYLVQDPELNLGLLEKLRAAGGDPVLAGRVDEALLVGLDFVPNWMFERELLARSLALVNQGSVDGLLLASSFACGTAAVVNEIVRRAVARLRPSLPVLTVLFDEHTAEAGLLTRLEAFVSLLGKRQREGARGTERTA